jgi:hypothetical protein
MQTKRSEVLEEFAVFIIVTDAKWQKVLKHSHISQAVRHDTSDYISHHLCLDLWVFSLKFRMNMCAMGFFRSLCAFKTQVLQIIFLV